MRQVLVLVLMGSMLLPSTSGMVLCFGADGHVAVESADHARGGFPHDEGTCEHEEADHSCEDAGMHSEGGCADIPLDIHLASLAAKKLQSDRLFANGPVSLILAGYDAASALNAACRLRHSPVMAAQRLSPLLLEKRTIVLRI